MSEKHTIYFAGRITGGRRYAGLYLRIVEQLRTYGNVLTEHVANPTVEADEDNAGLTDVFIHDRDMDWLYESDVIVAEVTQKSLGVGYEIGRAVALNKLVICLFRSDSEKSKILKLISAPLKTTCQDTLVFAYLLFLNFLL